jgi:hypothetical protein
MTGMRSHTDHQSRLDWWRRQIQPQPKTNLTIADFCRQLGVSVPTFSYWKRRVQAGLWTPSEPVAEASRSRPPTPAPACPSGEPHLQRRPPVCDHVRGTALMSSSGTARFAGG